MKRDHNTLSLSACFDVLRRVFPPTGVLMIGAGTGLGVWVQLFKEWEQPNCTLVEGDENQFKHLAKSIPERLGWQLRNEVVGARDEATTFFRASNPTESGLLEPETLSSLWPNLRTTEACEIHSVNTLEEILAPTSSTMNWLLIDCLPAVPMLESAANALSHVDLIAARALQDSAGPHQAEAGLDPLETLLLDQGFKRIAIEQERHPALCHTVYVRDAKSALGQQQAQWTKEKTDLTQARDAQAKQTAEAKTALTVCHDAQAKLVAEHRQALEALIQAKAQLEKEKTALSGRYDEQAKLAAERQKQLDELKQQIHQRQATDGVIEGTPSGNGETAVAASKPPPLAKNFENLTETLQQHKTELDAQLKKQADELVSLRKNLSANLGAEVATAARQIGDFISLQNYFNTGQLSDIQLEMSGWPVSTDFMLYLVRLINLNDYDLIIEFGSGVSTLAIAKTLTKLGPRRQGKPPVAFVSFDHLEQYYQQTQARLKYAGLADLVQLHLAPLADYIAPNGNQYPYYSCQTTLAALAQKHVRKQLRLLVIVDGPPGKTGKHARYPAGPLVMSYFKGANIDWLMDDVNRTDEKEIVSLWKKEISLSGLTVTETQIMLEKGASLIHMEG